MAELIIRRGLEEPDTSGQFVPHKPHRPDKPDGGKRFQIVSEYQPAGDQPTAIADLVASARDGERTQVLLGVTGSGKTFTMAKMIEELQRPALILAPNKILAAQLYGEFRSFFPDNAVEYFVSYYDYYQPEAYVPRSDTYIEKESSVNEAIDRMRHSATRSLLERDDVIIVASVSCLYGIGSVETYSAMIFDLKVGSHEDQRDIIRKLVALQYKRNDAAFQRGNFRVRGDNLEIFPSHYEDMAWRVSFFGDQIEAIAEFDPLTGRSGARLEKVRIYANSHYVTPGPTMKQAADAIRFELSSLLYPKVFSDFAAHEATYSDVSVLPTGVFFYGMRRGEEVGVEIEPGKTLVVKFLTIGDAQPDGRRVVYFELNGQPREVLVQDKKLTGGAVAARKKAEPGNAKHVAAPMPGSVASVAVAAGDEVAKGQKLLVLEAMKMQTTLYAEAAGRVAEVAVKQATQVEGGDLLIRFD